jgi:hypothetical protein
MKRVKYSNNLFHIYAYFKIIKFLFPLIIFGFTDISRRFYVVSFMFVSHEQEVDYKHFFSSLLELAIDLKIHLSIDYLVQVAWLACSKAALEIFPSLLIIMCWFHVMFNVL